MTNTGGGWGMSGPRPLNVNACGTGLKINIEPSQFRIVYTAEYTAYYTALNFFKKLSYACKWFYILRTFIIFKHILYGVFQCKYKQKVCVPYVS